MGDVCFSNGNVALRFALALDGGSGSDHCSVFPGIRDSNNSDNNYMLCLSDDYQCGKIELALEAPLDCSHGSWHAAVTWSPQQHTYSCTASPRRLHRINKCAPRGGDRRMILGLELTQTDRRPV